MQWRYDIQDASYPGVTDRVRNLLKRHGFLHLLDADRCSDDELMARGRVEYAGGPIGPKTLREIRTAAKACWDDFYHSDWPVF